MTAAVGEKSVWSLCVQPHTCRAFLWHYIAAAAESWKDHGILHVCFEDNQLRYHIAVCELIPRCNLACLVSAGACQELFEVTLADRPASQDHKLSPYVVSM